VRTRRQRDEGDRGATSMPCRHVGGAHWRAVALLLHENLHLDFVAIVVASEFVVVVTSTIRLDFCIYFLGIWTKNLNKNYINCDLGDDAECRATNLRLVDKLCQSLLRGFEGSDSDREQGLVPNPPG
jgi:hypothetical protein